MKSHAESRRLTLTIDGKPVAVEAGTSVAAAVWNTGAAAFRRSVAGEPRGPLCGMGVCFECRVTVDGVAHRRSCLIPCAPGMVVLTAAVERQEPG